MRAILAEGVNDETKDCDADAGIGDVKSGKGIGETNMQIEVKKVDNMSVSHAVGQVTEDAGQQQTQSKATPGIGRTASQ